MKKTTIASTTDIKIAVLFIGVQGAGKTGFYGRYFSSAYARIALGELGSRQAERQSLSDCISHGVSYVIDAQNLTRQDRCRYFSAAQKAGYRVIGYYFPCEMNDSLIRSGLMGDKNAKRRYKKALERLEIPDYSEGFDELYTVNIERTGEYITQRMPYAED